MTKDFPMLWKVYDHILTNPDTWMQGRWVTMYEAEPLTYLEDKVVLEVESWEDGCEIDVAGTLVSPTMCGTAFCFAGHVVNMTRSALFLVDEYEFRDGYAFVFVDTETGDVEEVGSVAKDVLGLDDYEAGLLFNGTNSIHQIRALIELWEKDELTV